MKRSFPRGDREGRSSQTPRVRRLVVETLEGRPLLSSLNSPNVKPFHNPVYAITAKVSPANDPGGTGNVFQSKISVVGVAPILSTVWLAEGPLGYYTNVTRADLTGHYSITITVPKGKTELRIFAENTALQYSVVTKLDVTRADPIIAWDSLALQAIQKENMTAPEAARSLAILHLAQYDAVAAVQFPSDAYLVHLAAPKGASASQIVERSGATPTTEMFDWKTWPVPLGSLAGEIIAVIA